jgi:hypothetical protein
MAHSRFSVKKESQPQQLRQSWQHPHDHYDYDMWQLEKQLADTTFKSKSQTLLEEVDQDIEFRRQAIKSAARAVAVSPAAAKPAYWSLTSQELLALHQLVLGPLDIPMGHLDWMELQEMPLPSVDLDWEVVRRLRFGRYAINYTLTWMQHTSAFAKHINLYKILQCPTRCAVFVEASRVLCAKQPRRTQAVQNRHAELTRLLDYMEMLCLSDASPFPPGLLSTYVVRTVDIEPAEPPQSTWEVLLDMVRDACHMPDLSMTSLRACIRGVFAESEVERMAKTMHSFSKLARLASTFFASASTKVSQKDNQHVRSKAMEWLREFLAVGCSCAR